ncbi:L-threonylcarbamoyladenylate synthase, partial [Psychrobacter sp. 1U2]
MKQSAPFTTNSVIQAADWLKEGKLLAYPTESVWGIGCDP